MTKSGGFTLLEVLAALAITGVLSAIALPAFLDACAATHSASARSAIATTLLDSARHSTAYQVEVVVCPTLTGEGCSGSTDWGTGWIAFVDADRNRGYGNDEPRLAHVTPIDGDVRLHSTRGRVHLVFQPDGSNGGSNVTFTLCDSRGPNKATTLVLANDGRMRTGTPEAPYAACL